MSGDVPRETQPLEVYTDILLKWNSKISLISRKTTRQTLKRLIDEVCIAANLIPPKFKRIYDLGSGNGLPGIPISILRTDLEVTLVERSRKKTLFLEEAIWQLGLKRCQVSNEDFTKVPYKTGGPTLITSIGLDVYSSIESFLWPLLEDGDGLLLFINEEDTKNLAMHVSCGTYWWHQLPDNKISGISYLEKG